jgi:fucose permease
VTTGLVLIAVGFDVMSRWPTVPTLGQIYGGMSILTSGLALAMTPATSLMMSAVPRSRSGMGSAMNDTTRELGAALGIATLGALLSSGYAEKIASALAGAPEQARVVAERSLAGALVLASNYGDVGAQFAQLAKAAWMESLEFSMVIGGVICSVSAIVASIWLPHREKWDPSRAEEPAATVPARTSTATTRAAEPGVAASPRTTRRPRRSRLPLEEDA